MTRQLSRFIGTLTLSLCALSSADALACGMFVPRSLEDTVPAIQQEQVLIVYDQQKQLEHFVREVSFEAGNTEFGFIVPTPKKPEVAAAKSPFKALREAYPFEHKHARDFGGAPGSRGIGAAEGGAPPVAVLSVQRVGKFTAFVLSATDAGALEKWLSDNRFQVPEKSRAWLDHYVALGFFHVAFRYDPPDAKQAERGLTSETVRISFSAPFPYYPYMEPVGSRTTRGRLLSVWFVSDTEMRPVAARERVGRVEHWRPWRAGLRYEAPADLGTKLGALSKLLPKGKLVMQTYRDLKSSREGWGDVLLVPKQPTPLGDAALADRRWLLPVLDPTLLAGAER
jgi:hypothetical protein